MELQQSVNITSMTNTCCCEDSIKTPDAGQQICPKQGGVERWCISLTFVVRMYHDALSYECQKRQNDVYGKSEFHIYHQNDRRRKNIL
jgi:hypothetical protein